MSPAKPFTEILTLLQRRSPEALDVLTEQYGRRLMSYALRRWGLSTSEVEDLLYETFYVLILKVDGLTFVSQAQFDGYLFTVFSNKLHEQFRKNRKAGLQSMVFDHAVASPDDETTDEESIQVPLSEQFLSDYYESEHLIESPQVAKMQAALDTLPAQDRDVLELWGQGYTYTEIGKLLDLDPTHLKVKCFRAKQKIINWFNANNDH